MSDIVEFDAMRVRRYLIAALRSFANDNPDTQYQRGYLAALCAVYREALNGGSDNDLLIGEAILEKGDE